eukprot:TRINITY_DN13901_c0_g1_i1.p3 TRINITY_DN13901_c0_g1~~TRINITY_DN13901_c0_g1_i1.p3  ORF type:complete len:103 (-),score=32.21 TRINITY_DN13901_c0_g1_i1:240-548(-)
MIRRPPRSTLSSSSAASDVYKRQGINAEYGGSALRNMEQQSKTAEHATSRPRKNSRKKVAAIAEPEGRGNEDWGIVPAPDTANMSKSKVGTEESECCACVLC